MLNPALVYWRRAAVQSLITVQSLLITGLPVASVEDVMLETELLAEPNNPKTTHRRLSATGRRGLVLLTAALLSATRARDARADAGESDTTKLAKETQNPVANLISVPFQNNFNFGAGPENKMYWILNFQPVVPISLNEDWNRLWSGLAAALPVPVPLSKVTGFPLRRPDAQVAPRPSPLWNRSSNFRELSERLSRHRPQLLRWCAEHRTRNSDT
jgi:hypothetical protein